MAISAPRLFVFGLLLLGLLTVASDRSIVSAPQIALAAPIEVFSMTTPPKVYSGVPSHGVPADANPTLGNNGYCVFVQEYGHTWDGGNLGFRVQNGTILSTDYFNNGSATTTDDVYCVVAVADRILDEIPGPNGSVTRPDMVITWSYLDGGSPATATLNIKVVTVELTGTDGTAGAIARVCTIGWDPLFLTGFTSNNPPSFPNETDKVVGADWDTVPSSPPDVLGVIRDGTEWCVNLTSTTAIDDVDAEFNFWALYNINDELDDVLITEFEEDVVSLEPGPPELRHITPDGQVDLRRATNPNVVGARHTACVLPSVPDDVLLASNIQISSPTGIAAVGLTVFAADALSVPGVPVGTKCFYWSAVQPGRHDVFASMNVSASNPSNIGTGPRNLSWDTNLDGNDGLGPGGALVKYWDVIDHTVINTGGDWREPGLTNGTIDLPVAFNVRNGTFVADIDLVEWVIGTRPGPDGSTGEPIDGVPVRFKITSQCGYFVDEDDGTDDTSYTEFVATTVAGRVEFTIDTFDDTGCGQNSIIKLEVHAMYPGGLDYPLPDVETLTIHLRYTPPHAAPIVAWAGTTLTLSYGFSGTCDEQPVFWTKGGGSGAFVPGGSEFATTTLIDCETTIQFESEVPGNIDISVTLGGDQRTKVIIPLFFLAFEDLQLSVETEDPTVSQLTRLDANVRGWFVGDNPSGRPAETKPDGRKVPADRWVLPDDWSTLRGPDDFRPAWPANVALPPVPITFFMENEGVVNNFKTGVKKGASGWFDPASSGDEYAYDFNPTTGERSKLGTELRPRIITTNTQASGAAYVRFFGDENLSFEGCSVNLPTGNPHCEVEDIVGRTSFSAIVDYPEFRNRGNLVPIRSNNANANFHWVGYKRVTWEPGATENIRYVVAHLKDRDGFCDAVHWNNTLGVLVEFAIDSDDGIITWRADEPSVLNNDTGNRHFAIVTTFDTLDDGGEAMNIGIIKTIQTPDECQAWIRIDNSLGKPVNVQVTFSAPPAPVPGDIRITDLHCGDPGNYVTITNVGTNKVSLAGWALRSAARSINQEFVSEEHLGLEGHLAPGESLTIGGNTTINPWLFAGGEEAWISPNDYAALRWNEALVDFQHCDGEHFHPETVLQKSDQEGVIVLDIIVPFDDRGAEVLSAGWNLISIGGGGISVEEALGQNADLVSAIYVYDEATGEWLLHVPDAPDGVNTFTEFEAGRVYWVYAKTPFTLVVPR